MKHPFTRPDKLTKADLHELLREADECGILRKFTGKEETSHLHSMAERVHMRARRIMVGLPVAEVISAEVCYHCRDPIEKNKKGDEASCGVRFCQEWVLTHKGSCAEAVDAANVPVSVLERSTTFVLI